MWETLWWLNKNIIVFPKVVLSLVGQILILEPEEMEPRGRILAGSKNQLGLLW
ncbi:MAG TPA: hypothetical protein VMW34_18950 [Anaerolineales bacterium]|jgi:hypothetical protein|nr:hypothetical protein [Anaerolineales bacterium]